MTDTYFIDDGCNCGMCLTRREMQAAVDTLRWHLLHAEAELANAHWTLRRINGRAQYAEHGEDTEDQQALREIGDEARRGLQRGTPNV